MAQSDFETAEARTFAQLCDVHDVVLDIGANVGFYSCLAASRGNHVLAFEPAPRNLAFLYQNLWSNGFSAVEVFPIGLGPQPGLMPLYGFGGITSFVLGWAQACGKGSHFAPVATLDFFTARKFEGQRLLIKMDVEGFELAVLSGAIETLSHKPQPTWMVEILLNDSAIPDGINANFRETFEVFWSNNYRCKALESDQTEITPDIVEKWTISGAVERGTRNFLFTGE